MVRLAIGMPGHKLSIFSWALYDFANTIFSMNIISTYFPLWVTIDQGRADILYSVILSGSMAMAAISSPILGAISDQWERRMPFLIIWTLTCVAATAGIGLTNHFYWGLVMFVVANYCYQTGLVFYNGLLPVVSRGTSIGRVSGYGVAMGYIGAILGLKLVEPFVQAGGRTACFIPTAFFFLIFSLPCFLVIQEIRTPSSKNRIKWQKIIKGAFSAIIQTIKEARAYRGMWIFLLASFIYLDAVHTVIAFMSIYAKKVMFFSDRQLVNFLIISTVFAAVGSYIIGFITAKLGSKGALSLTLWIWVGAISLALLSQGGRSFWLVGPLAGIGMGGVWVAGRTMIVELAPTEKVGEFFGLYGLSGKLSSIVGPLIWGITVQSFSWLGIQKYRLAIFVLLLFLLAGLMLLRQVPHIPGQR
jgi:MFS transporter, UMF1 family